MTLVLVIRTLEGIAIVSDTLSTATEMRNIEGKDKMVRYAVHKRRKITRVGDYAVVHAGLTLINGRTIDQVVRHLNFDPHGSADDFIEAIRLEFIEELAKDPIVKQFKMNEMLISLGIVGYKDNKPFVYRFIFMPGEEDPIDYMVNDDAFDPPYYGLDYFGDYHFIRMVIKAAKAENLLKPFEILTIYEALDFIRSLMRFSIDFQRFMVEATVQFPLESAIITRKNGFEWVDKMEIKPFRYEDNEEGIPYV
ncbi:MAG: hypothetical protein INQ03_18825 [Candidatus Heimdallarchaeota archaeon]|nr:hypothetical protein [Candidatus Heimdallarchaeota archaeon]